MPGPDGLLTWAEMDVFVPRALAGEFGPDIQRNAEEALRPLVEAMAAVDAERCLFCGR
jgi:hypothetical protein